VFAAAAPHLRSLSVTHTSLSPPWARALGAAAWRHEALDLSSNSGLDAAGLAALAAAPTFALRRLNLMDCNRGNLGLFGAANAPWPLKELDLPQSERSNSAPPRPRPRSRRPRSTRACGS
jgi:hypothetical protein